MSILYTVVAVGGAAGVSGGTAGKVAVVGYITVSGAVVVNCGAAGRQQGVGVAAGGSSKISVSCRHGSGLSGW